MDSVVGKAMHRYWLRQDDRNVGLWYEAQVDMADEYGQMIAKLCKQGKMGYSSGAAGHLVQRKSNGTTNEIVSWPIAEASITPTPAEYRNTVESIKDTYGMEDDMEEGEGEEMEEFIITPEEAEPQIGEHAGAYIEKVYTGTGAHIIHEGIEGLYESLCAGIMGLDEVQGDKTPYIVALVSMVSPTVPRTVATAIGADSTPAKSAPRKPPWVSSVDCGMQSVFPGQAQNALHLSSGDSTAGRRPARDAAGYRSCRRKRLTPMSEPNCSPVWRLCVIMTIEQLESKKLAKHIGKQRKSWLASGGDLAQAKSLMNEVKDIEDSESNEFKSLGETGPVARPCGPTMAVRLGQIKSVFSGSREEQNLKGYVMGQFALAVAGNKTAEKWLKANGHYQAQVEGTTTAGGFLTPDLLSADLVYLREQYGIARQKCRIVPMTSDVQLVPNATASTTVVYPGENTAITPSDMTFAQISLTAKKMAILTIVSKELNEDSVIVCRKRSCP